MGESRRRSRAHAIMLVGAAYVVIGIVFSALAKSPDYNYVRVWRLAAWVASAAVGAAHIWYERHRLGRSPRVTALQTAGAVALGAFGLALAANVHWLFARTSGQRPPLLALPIWPVVTALPVFLFVLAVTITIDRVSRRA
jgi:hypothetical protein